MNKTGTVISRCFLEVKKEFPFSGYMDGTLDKYVSVISQIMKEYPPKSALCHYFHLG